MKMEKWLFVICGQFWQLLSAVLRVLIVLAVVNVWPLEPVGICLAFTGIQFSFSGCSFFFFCWVRFAVFWVCWVTMTGHFFCWMWKSPLWHDLCCVCIGLLYFQPFGPDPYYCLRCKTLPRPSPWHKTRTDLIWIFNLILDAPLETPGRFYWSRREAYKKICVEWAWSLLQTHKYTARYDIIKSLAVRLSLLFCCVVCPHLKFEGWIRTKQGLRSITIFVREIKITYFPNHALWRMVFKYLQLWLYALVKIVFSC